MSKSTKTILIVVVVLLIFLLICCLGSGIVYYFIAKESNDHLQDDLSKITEEIVEESIEEAIESDIEEDVVPEIEEIVPEVVLKGTISGQVGYPSEFMPSQKVCAVNLSSQNTVCTKEIKGTLDPEYSGRGYALELPVGNYHVYSRITEAGEYLQIDAYYTKFVECGMEVSCSSHEKVIVEVKADVVLNNIDPVDWYAP